MALKEGEIGSLGWNNLLANNIKDSLDPRHGDILTKLVEPWLRAFTPPPHTLLKLLHSNIPWSEDIQFINNGFTYASAHGLHHKGIQCVDDIWDSEYRTFLSWDDAHDKFKLTW